MWLTADKLSPYKFYQYLFATADADVVKFLRMLTFLPMSDIREIEARMASDDYVPNTAQKLLAEEVPPLTPCVFSPYIAGLGKPLGDIGRRRFCAGHPICSR